MAQPANAIRSGRDGLRRTHYQWRLSRRRAPAVQISDPPLTLVPSYPDLPMEEVYPRQAKTDIPEVYLREIGTSRIVYFPWDIDRIFWEMLNVDHGKLLSNAVTGPPTPNSRSP